VVRHCGWLALFGGRKGLVGHSSHMVSCLETFLWVLKAWLPSLEAS